MPTPLDRDAVKRRLDDGDLRGLFIEDLGWDHGGADVEAEAAGRTFVLRAVAHKRGMVAFRYAADSDEAFPDHPTRQKIEKAVARSVREHLIVYAAPGGAQYWQWVKREPGRPDRTRTHIRHPDQPGEALIQKLEQLVFTLDEEEDLTLVDVSGRVRAAFDVEKVTRRFYDRFRQEHRSFLGFIEGVAAAADREWYASLMLNRMMFIYFIQKRGFLDGDPDYLRNRLARVRGAAGGGRFHRFYRLFLLRLFHEGLGQPAAERAPELAELLGRIPYLNGGLFDVHDLERDNPAIRIPDEAFERIFAFFDAYDWHLDDRPLRGDNEINPDVLGYIFEKYVNQKQMGAYYTKEDITGYISRNTVVPFLFDRAKKDCAIAFKPGGGVWRLLADDPDRYFHEAVRHGVTWDVNRKQALAETRALPPEIAAGVDDVARRGGWNETAPPDYGLPTETWREHAARRRRYEEVRARLAAGEVTSVNDLITCNLDIEKFAQDAIAASEGPELVRAFWKALRGVSVLDPTCGSGAFLFAALNVLEPLYNACLDAMRGFLDDAERSPRKRRPEHLRDFRRVLEQVGKHASERYFVLKSIVIDNLYGVDVMEEAVEICKLRLFLKLVAQLDSYEQIEPLPDIDFNVRAGNTLVGFTSIEEVRRAFRVTAGGQRRMLYAEDEDKLKRIEEDAELADRAFRQFRAMQIEHGMEAGAQADAKAELRRRLDELRNELDEYLAGDYRVKSGAGGSGGSAFRKWRESHQPFHWFVEFHGIMRRGGFDAIVGNPPYVEYGRVRDDYTITGYDTESCGNLFAHTTERSLALLKSHARFGFITPISLTAAQRMAVLQNHLFDRNSDIWLSNFALRPASLFPGVMQRNTIVLTRRAGQSRPEQGRGYTTDYVTWYSEERPALFPTLLYLPVGESRQKYIVPKISHPQAYSALLKILSRRGPYKSYREFVGEHKIYYHNAGGYWIKTFTSRPYYRSLRESAKRHSTITELSMPTQYLATLYCAVLNSSVFYFFWKSTTDARHLYPSDIARFPVGNVHDFDSGKRISRLVKDLMQGFQRNSRRIVYGQAEVDQYNVSPLKPIIDKIDLILAETYGFTDEEMDFIINYDIKYRMGRESAGPGARSEDYGARKPMMPEEGA